MFKKNEKSKYQRRDRKFRTDARRRRFRICFRGKRTMSEIPSKRSPESERWQ